MDFFTTEKCLLSESKDALFDIFQDREELFDERLGISPVGWIHFLACEFDYGHSVSLAQLQLATEICDKKLDEFDQLWQVLQLLNNLECRKQILMRLHIHFKARIFVDSGCGPRDPSSNPAWGKLV